MVAGPIPPKLGEFLWQMRIIRWIDDTEADDPGRVLLHGSGNVFGRQIGSQIGHTPPLHTGNGRRNQGANLVQLPGRGW